MVLTVKAARALFDIYHEEPVDIAAVKNAYRKRVVVLHPDKDSGNAGAFKAVNDAYHTLLEEAGVGKPEQAFDADPMPPAPSPPQPSSAQFSHHTWHAPPGASNDNWHRQPQQPRSPPPPTDDWAGKSEQPHSPPPYWRSTYNAQPPPQPSSPPQSNDSWHRRPSATSNATSGTSSGVWATSDQSDVLYTRLLSQLHQVDNNVVVVVANCPLCEARVYRKWQYNTKEDASQAAWSHAFACTCLRS